MRKKKGGGGGANWMDTYGDMVTLLLCFFVLLYSMSTISEENWKAIVMSFNPKAIETITETSGNDGPNADPNTDDGSGMGFMPTMPEEDAPDPDVSGENATGEAEQVERDMAMLYDMLVQYIEEQNAQSTISVTKGDGRVFVTFNQTVFFNGNDWSLRPESYSVLESVGAMLSTVARSVEEVRILGHTAQARADEPNRVTEDRVLSAQRAANALAYIQEHCDIDPARMISEGYGQWRPVATNDTEEGRSQNRRVEMIVSGKDLDLGDSVQTYYTEAGRTDSAGETANQ
ncbi:MAG: flagellar motor protein MotB [Oscillospiraceae bacterium]|nr:flagellar motor protein MotB [Oscillospiraceae bacterium]